MRQLLARGVFVVSVIAAGLAPTAASAAPPGPGVTGDVGLVAASRLVPATADTYVKSWAPRTNYGARGYLVVQGGASSAVTYLKFTVTGLLTAPLTRARLRVHASTLIPTSSAVGGSVYRTARTDWRPEQITYANRPALEGPALGAFGSVRFGEWYDVDVTAAVKAAVTGVLGTGVVSLAVMSTDASKAVFDSSRAGPSVAPALILDTAPIIDRSATMLTAGDVAGCHSALGGRATAALLGAVSGTIAPIGDLVYPSGTAERFSQCYGPTWGLFKSRTRPAVGNHEYEAAGARPYFAYFGAAAGPAGKGYYSYELGSWHVIALNSNCHEIKGGCGPDGDQVRWLRADLASHPAACTLAYWHHPLFTSGSTHHPHEDTRPLFQALFDAGAEIVLTAHNHNYERFAPQTPGGHRDDARGIRAFVVGTGGESHDGFRKPAANSEVRDATTFGVLRLTLGEGTYQWQFLPVAGKHFTDAGSGTCH